MIKYCSCFVVLLGSPVNSPVDGEEGTSGVDTAMCPVCEERIHGSGDELNAHVEACLRKVRCSVEGFCNPHKTLGQVLYIWNS